ncbi:MAG: hypothetical protein H6922_03325 [Pseudomonadaceae bacterium]|nr:hypothetical protein [Pseudomonadaceae bacterium]
MSTDLAPDAGMTQEQLNELRDRQRHMRMLKMGDTPQHKAPADAPETRDYIAARQPREDDFAL